MQKNKLFSINPAFWCLVALSPFIHSCSFNESAIADDLELGFYPSNPFPERNMKYDDELKEADKVSGATLRTLMNDIQFPQSEAALTGLLGHPYAEDGGFLYWEIEGGSELAIYFAEGAGQWFTVGQY